MSASLSALSRSGPCQIVRLTFQNQTPIQSAARSSAGVHHFHVLRPCDRRGSLQTKKQQKNKEKTICYLRTVSLEYNLSQNRRQSFLTITIIIIIIITIVITPYRREVKITTEWTIIYDIKNKC